MKRLLTEPVSGAEGICRVLEEAGVDLVLGIPGGDIMALFDALYDHRTKIRTLLVRDEAAAAIMAEAYGRWTGRPAAVIGQGAWILSKAAMGALEAFTGASPMLLLTDLSDRTPFGHLAPSQTGTGHYGTWDARVSFSGFMKEVMEATDPVQAVQLTQLAVKHAMSGCPGPVGVIYYGGALRGRVGPDSQPPVFASAGYLQRAEIIPTHAQIAPALALLAGAERPTIIAGNGVRLSRASAALIALAEAVAAPVITTASGKGVMPETHPLAGGVMGDFGIEAANRLVGEADLILAIGTRLAPGDTVKHHRDLVDPSRQKIIQIDIEPRHLGWTMPVDCGLLGDAAATLTLLREGVTPARANGADRVRSAMATGGFESAECFSKATPMLPQRFVQLLFEALPADVAVTGDAGENRIFLNHHYRVKAPGMFLQPAATGAMGYAIPSALGVKLAEPSRRVVAVLGDGGFAMSVAAIMTAVEQKLPIVMIVLNNGILGWVRHLQGNRIIASELGAFDHAAIARALGCDGVRITQEKDFKPALDAALASSRPTVIEVMVSGEESWEKVASSLRLSK